MKIKITADSTCDLLDVQLCRHQITLLPLYVNLDDRCLRDVVDITPDDIYAFVDGGGGKWSTSAGNIADYTELFSTCLETYDAVIHISLSAELSSSYQNAVVAAGEFDNVYVVDSRNLSTGHGLVVLRCAQLVESGRDAAAVVEELKAYIAKINASFILSQLTYLHRGGRCSGVAALGANLLKLKPCIEVRDGKMDVGKKYRGSFEKSMEAYIRDRLSERDGVDRSLVFIVHSGLSGELLELAKRTVEDCSDFREIVVARAGCTISSHCGPGTIGVIFAHR